jgi:hypothetical protein
MPAKKKLFLKIYAFVGSLGALIFGAIEAFLLVVSIV